MNTIDAASPTNPPLPTAQSRTRWLVWLGRGLLGLLITLVVLAGGGVSYQAIATVRDARAFPPPGQLVDVGGYKMHIVCAGPQTANAPTVILAHVGDGNVAQWGLIQPEIAKHTRVCAYDRAGFGWSERGPTPRDGRQSMSELHTLLANAGIAPPYILVGHSYGGNVARLYVAAYPQDVAGLVLVDPGQLFDTPGVPPAINAAWQADGQTVMRLAPYLSRLGLLRVLAALGVMPGHGDLPPATGAAYDAVNLSTKFWDTLSDQNAAMATTSKQVLATPHNWGDLLVIVLSAAVPDDESRQVWTAVNAELATHATNGVRRVVDGATHMGLALHQESAQATIAAILQVVEAARTGAPINTAALLRSAALPQPAGEADFAAIDAYLIEQMAALRIPGLALGIVQRDQVVHLKGFGIADPTGRAVTPQTPFALNSISKSFVALAVMQLVEQGRIELDAPVQRYLPWFQVADAAAASRITVRHLLHHTSGLPASAAYPELARPATATETLEARVRHLRTTPLNRPVGTTFEYTDANYDLLGLLVQTVAGQPYPRYVQQQILTPLAMTHSATTQPNALPPTLATGYRSWFGWPVPFRQWYAHAMLPSGDLIATAEDMTHYLIAQLNEGRYGEQQVLSPQGIATLHEPAVAEGRGDRFYGMGWISRSLNDIPVVRHDGTSANYYADVALDPAGKWGVALLLNFNSFHLYGGRIQALTGGILRLLHAQPPPTLPAMHHPLLYPLLLIVLGITALLLLWLGRTLWRWRRQYKAARQPSRRWALSRHFVLPLLWALILFVLVPQLTYPLAVLRINIPDFGYTLLVCGASMVLWCCVWAGRHWL